MFLQGEYFPSWQLIGKTSKTTKTVNLKRDFSYSMSFVPRVQLTASVKEEMHFTSLWWILLLKLTIPLLKTLFEVPFIFVQI